MLPTTRYKPTEDLLCQQVGAEAVLLDMRSSKYFGLSPVASRVWQLLADGESIASATEIIGAEYGQPLARVAADISAFVEATTSRGLLTQQA